MKKMLKWLTAVGLVLSLNACGGGSDTCETPATATPIIVTNECTTSLNTETLENGDVVWNTTSEGNNCEGVVDTNGTVEHTETIITVTESCTQLLNIEPQNNGDIYWFTTTEGNNCDGIENTEGTIEHVVKIKEVEVIVNETCIQTVNTEPLENGDIYWYTTSEGDCDAYPDTNGTVEHDTVIEIVELPCECPEVCSNPAQFQIFMDWNQDGEPQENEIQAARDLFEDGKYIRLILTNVDTGIDVVSALALENGTLTVPLSDGVEYKWKVVREEDGTVVNEATYVINGGAWDQIHISAEEIFTYHCDDGLIYIRFDPPVDENGAPL